MLSLVMGTLIQGLITTSGIFGYTFTAFADNVSNSALGGMLYSDSPFRNCSIIDLSVTADKNGASWMVTTHSPGLFHHILLAGLNIRQT